MQIKMKVNYYLPPINQCQSYSFWAQPVCCLYIIFIFFILGMGMALSARLPMWIEFYADHPFIYYILNKQNIVLFGGKLLHP